jgi:hypothetical protein
LYRSFCKIFFSFQVVGCQHGITKPTPSYLMVIIGKHTQIAAKMTP